MGRGAKTLSIAALGIFMAAPSVCAQVPEKPPAPAINPDWDYTTPGPAKCVEAGNVYLHKKNLKGALSRFQEAVKDDPHYAPAYLGLGKVYERMNDKQKALNAYKQYLDELPSAQEAAEAKEAKRAIERLQKDLGTNGHTAAPNDK
jgi:tetratricopeptide (TPR) repeat protein